MNLEALLNALDEMADLLELDGANSFKSGAYTKASRALAQHEGDLKVLVQEDRLTDVPGIGKGLSDKIKEFAATGRITELEELRARLPEGLRGMLAIPGFGPKKARIVFTELDVRSIEELRGACEDGRVQALKGFGEKSAAKILDGIRQMQQYAGQYRIDAGLLWAEALLEYLQGCPAVGRVELAGSLRRRKEVVKDLDFVAATEDPVAVMQWFVDYPGAGAVVAHGGTKSSIQLRTGPQADLRCVAPGQFPFALMHFTGSKEHNTRLRQIARERGLKLNEYGLFPEGSEQSLPARSEADIQGHLGLEFIVPELREDMGEVEAALEGRLPHLIERNSLRGILHLHTTYSDGKPLLEHYLAWAKANGIEWMGITDHSQSLAVANGLTEERVLAQHAEIDALNAKWASRGVRLLKGIESDILADGSLDYPEAFLPHFEFVIASVHSLFNLTEAEQTRRILRALEHPRTTILGHMTGRLLLQRPGYPLDQKEVIRAAGRMGACIELNANPYRLDMDWRLVHYALEQGCRVCISPDAHTLEGLYHLDHGLAMARKGWATAKDVLNTLSARDFLAYARRRVGG